jgi:hypothetical protein
VSAERRYSSEPPNARAFSKRYDRMYSRIARAYDIAVPMLPFWRRWLSAALPHLIGPRVLEVSFGTGWLLCQYADRFEAHGIDLNESPILVHAVVCEVRRARKLDGVSDPCALTRQQDSPNSAAPPRCSANTRAAHSKPSSR